MTDKQIIIDGEKITKEDFIDYFSIELTNRNVDERKEIGSKYFDIILRKEQECEDLKFYINNYKHIWELDKLKQTLAEIKEIAEGIKVYDPLAKQILQKINEVDNDKSNN